MKRFVFASTLLVVISSAAAQPNVSAVVNAASNALEGQPNAALAQGSLFLVYGMNLGPASLLQASSFPLRENLGGTSARIAISGVAVNALMVYTGATQMAAVLPSSTPVGAGTLTITYDGQSGAPVPVTVVKSNFGVFSINQNGGGPGVVTFPDNSVVGVAKVANPGETLVIWGTGLGPVVGNEAAGPLPGDQAGVPVEIYIGGQTAMPVYRGRSGCCPGLDQIAFIVPPGVSGCNVPIAIRIENQVSNFVTIAVASSGRVCSDPGAIEGAGLESLFNKPRISFGSVSLSRTNVKTADPGGQTIEDNGSASFLIAATARGIPTSLLQRVSVGACSVSVFSRQSGNPSPNPTLQSLDAGLAINVDGPNGSRTLNKTQAGGLTSYFAKLSGSPSSGYLDAGMYTISSPGGPEVGGFSTTLVLPPPLIWANREAIEAVDRGNDLRVTWTGGDPAGFVDITGSNFASGIGNVLAGASFSCRARNSDGGFTIPSLVLLGLPVASQGLAPIPGSLAVGASTNLRQIPVPGVDLAVLTASVENSRTVTYR